MTQEVVSHSPVFAPEPVRIITNCGKFTRGVLSQDSFNGLPVTVDTDHHFNVNHDDRKACMQSVVTTCPERVVLITHDTRELLPVAKELSKYADGKVVINIGWDSFADPDVFGIDYFKFVLSRAHELPSGSWVAMGGRIFKPEQARSIDLIDEFIFTDESFATLQVPQGPWLYDGTDVLDSVAGYTQRLAVQLWAPDCPFDDFAPLILGNIAKKKAESPSLPIKAMQCAFPGTVRWQNGLPEALTKIILGEHKFLRGLADDKHRKGSVNALEASLGVLAHYILRDDEPTLLLIDRDDTVDASPEHWETIGRGQRFLRPGLMELLDEIRCHRSDLEIGMLTAKSPFWIFHAHNVTRYNRIRLQFDQNHIYGTIQFRQRERLEAAGNAIVNGLRNREGPAYLDENVAAHVNISNPSFNSIGKAVTVLALQQRFPGRRIIVFDDLMHLPFFLPAQCIRAFPLGWGIVKEFGRDVARQLF